jgi:hypothetical protein
MYTTGYADQARGRSGLRFGKIIEKPFRAPKRGGVSTPVV